VIPAWNEERLLAGTLRAADAAARATGLPYRIVVADDASTDDTAGVARAHGAEVVACDNRQIAATRNAGARATDADLLVFVDADTEVTPQALCAAVAGIEAGATYGGADLTWDGEIPLWTRALLRGSLWLYRIARLSSGAFLFCTREAFERSGGFDESLYAAEEYYLSRELRRTGRFVWVKHRVVTSGRKLRAFSVRELLGELWRLTLAGKRGLADRDRLDLWYGPRARDEQR